FQGGVAVYRFNADGSLDRGFGNQGVASSPFTSLSGLGTEISSLFVQPDGKIVVEAANFDSTTAPTQVFVRLTSTGQLDKTFGNAGMISEQFGGGMFVIAQVSLQA